jgi:uncharacterized protein YbcI
MANGHGRSLGEVRAQISSEIIKLQAEYYGRGPTRARTYIVEDVVVVVLEISVVEQATGRKVRTFLSDTDVDEDISVETFLLADGRTDMAGFEED